MEKIKNNIEKLKFDRFMTKERNDKINTAASVFFSAILLIVFYAFGNKDAFGSNRGIILLSGVFILIFLMFTLLWHMFFKHKEDEEIKDLYNKLLEK